jgi:hypothetical protein
MSLNSLRQEKKPIDWAARLLSDAAHFVPNANLIQAIFASQHFRVLYVALIVEIASKTQIIRIAFEIVEPVHVDPIALVGHNLQTKSDL